MVTPEELRRPIFRSLHWSHPGRNVKLQVVADISWSQIHREILLAQTCSQCKDSGKYFKTLITQSNFGKLTSAEAIIDELAVDFAGPLKIAPKNKQYLLVAIDYKTGWPSGTFVIRPTAETLEAFLNEYIAQNSIR